jgi:hypothetical protein
MADTVSLGDMHCIVLFNGTAPSIIEIVKAAETGLQVAGIAYTSCNSFDGTLTPGYRVNLVFELPGPRIANVQEAVTSGLADAGFSFKVPIACYRHPLPPSVTQG